MSPAAGRDDDGAAARQRAHERPVPAVADDDVAARHRARVGHPLDEPRVRRRRARAVAGSSGRRFQVASTRTRRRPPSPVERGAQQACAGRPARSTGATSTSGPSPGGSSTSPNGGSHSSGPTTCVFGGRRGARVLELRERRDERQLRARSRRAARPERRQARAAARVSLSSRAPELQPAADQRVQQRPPRRGPSARPRQPRAERVRRRSPARGAGRRAG